MVSECVQLLELWWDKGFCASAQCHWRVQLHTVVSGACPEETFLLVAGGGTVVLHVWWGAMWPGQWLVPMLSEAGAECLGDVAWGVAGKGVWAIARLPCHLGVGVPQVFPPPSSSPRLGQPHSDATCMSQNLRIYHAPAQVGWRLPGALTLHLLSSAWPRLELCSI